MQARPHRRKDQLPLRSLRDLRSPYVFAPVRPRLARWENKRPQGAAGHWRKWGHIRGTFDTLHHSYIIGLVFVFEVMISTNKKFLETDFLQTGSIPNTQTTNK